MKNLLLFWCTLLLVVPAWGQNFMAENLSPAEREALFLADLATTIDSLQARIEIIETKPRKRNLRLRGYINNKMLWKCTIVGRKGGPVEKVSRYRLPRIPSQQKLIYAVDNEPRYLHLNTRDSEIWYARWSHPAVSRIDDPEAVTFWEITYLRDEMLLVIGRDARTNLKWRRYFWLE